MKRGEASIQLVLGVCWGEGAKERGEGGGGGAIPRLFCYTLVLDKVWYHEVGTPKIEKPTNHRSKSETTFEPFVTCWCCFGGGVDVVIVSVAAVVPAPVAFASASAVFLTAAVIIVGGEGTGLWWCFCCCYRCCCCYCCCCLCFCHFPSISCCSYFEDSTFCVFEKLETFLS